MTTTYVTPLPLLPDVQQIAAGLRRAHSLAGARIDKAVLIVAFGHVSPIGTDGYAVRSDSDPAVLYTVTFTFCECRDHERGHVCKHRFAAKIYAQLQARERLAKARRGNALYEALFPDAQKAAGR